MSVLLTTADNPFNPHTDYTNWYIWDMSRHYDTVRKLSNELGDADDMSEEEFDDWFNVVVNEFIENDDLGIYLLIEEGDETPINRELFEQTSKEFEKSSQ